MQTQDKIPKNSDREKEPMDTLQKLQQPLDTTRIHNRPVSKSGQVPYLRGYDVINKANQLFEFGWSFELLSQPQIERWQKQVRQWDNKKRKELPVLDEQGQPIFEQVGMVYITGQVIITLKDRQYIHADVGRCSFYGDTPEAMDTALAGCATDCLKRCFRQLGEQFGNCLYDKDARPQNTQAQKKVRRYEDGSLVNGNVSEQKAYDEFTRQTGDIPLSKPALRTWLKEHSKKPAAENLAA
jgi:recombination DNA repair RAD52 pathway protein